MAANDVSTWDVLIDRDDLHHTSIAPVDQRSLTDGEVRLAIDAFGLSANNVTYAAFGDMIGYWGFFPVGDHSHNTNRDDTNWGRVPVWGFADVVESTVDALPVGDRVYGYLPMSTALIVEPARINDRRFFDAAAHRAALPATYNRYARAAGDPGYSPEREDAQMLLRPLFVTSFLIDDFLDDNDFFGGPTVIATSASSKTAFGAAELLSRRDGITVIGLTSPANVEFCERLGTYDRVFTYEQVLDVDNSPLDPDTPSVLVDFAGNRPVISAVHARLDAALRHSAVIGGTHWDADADADPIAGPEPTFFFAPARIEKRNADWGARELDARLADAWIPFVARTDDLLAVQHGHGPQDVVDRFLELLGGAVPPSMAHVLHP